MSILLGVCRIADLLEHLPEGDAWLGTQERHRLAAMTHPQRRAQYRAGHGYARQLLARRGGGDPMAWTLDRDGRGMPLAWHDGVPGGLHVSLAHSAGYVACAVARRPVGVDIESPARERDLLALAKSLYPSEFLRELEGCDADARRAVFFRRWTLDEAQGKADGRGLRMHALRGQAWRPVSHDEADGWSWDLRDGWLAVAVPDGGEPPRFEIDADAPDGAARAWRREALAGAA